jgi:hypothetical protein
MAIMCIDIVQNSQHDCHYCFNNGHNYCNMLLPFINSHHDSDGNSQCKQHDLYNVYNVSQKYCCESCMQFSQQYYVQYYSEYCMVTEDQGGKYTTMIAAAGINYADHLYSCFQDHVHNKVTVTCGYISSIITGPCSLLNMISARAHHCRGQAGSRQVTSHSHGSKFDSELAARPQALQNFSCRSRRRTRILGL